MAVKSGFSQADADQRQGVSERPGEQLIPDAEDKGQREPSCGGADEHQDAKPEVFAVRSAQKKQDERADPRKCLKEREDHGAGQLPMVCAAGKRIAVGDLVRIAHQGSAKARPSTKVGGPTRPMSDTYAHTS